MLRSSLPLDGSIELRTDEHATYAKALSGLQAPSIEHRTTHSKEPRTPRNPLFAVNAHPMFMRHSGANHKRETIAFSMRTQGVVYRHAVFQVWKNLVKSASERHPAETPAQRFGVTHRRWTIEELLVVRRFPTRQRLGKRIETYSFGMKRSRFLRAERRHDLMLAI